MSFCIVVAIVASAAVFTKMRVRSAPPYPSNLMADLQAGVASEAPCPTSSAGVQQAVDNAASFIAYRSGISLSQTTKQTLTQLEQSSFLASSGLSRQQVKDVITATIMNTISSVTNAQIEDMAKSNFRVLPCFADEHRPSEVQLRASKGNFDSELFQEKAIEFREGSTPEGLSLRAAAPTYIGNEVDSRLDALAYASEGQWKVGSFSPYRVFILAYALVSDDSLSKSQSGIANSMQTTENWLNANRGIDCPSAGRCPYGEHGYIYCTPMSIFFSQGVQTDLLNRIQAILG